MQQHGGGFSPQGSYRASPFKFFPSGPVPDELPPASGGAVFGPYGPGPGWLPLPPLPAVPAVPPDTDGTRGTVRRLPFSRCHVPHLDPAASQPQFRCLEHHRHERCRSIFHPGMGIQPPHDHNGGRGLLQHLGKMGLAPGHGLYHRPVLHHQQFRTVQVFAAGSHQPCRHDFFQRLPADRFFRILPYTPTSRQQLKKFHTHTSLLFSLLSTSPAKGTRGCSCKILSIFLLVLCYNK